MAAGRIYSPGEDDEGMCVSSGISITRSPESTWLKEESKEESDDGRKEANVRRKRERPALVAWPADEAIC